jgi:hypothetical protein
MEEERRERERMIEGKDTRVFGTRGKSDEREDTDGALS